MHRSATCNSGGKNPHWNDSFYCSITGDPILKVEVWDNDAIEDDLVGQGSYNLMPYLNNRIDTTRKYLVIQFGLTFITMEEMQVSFALDYSLIQTVLWESA